MLAETPGPPAHKGRPEGVVDRAAASTTPTPPPVDRERPGAAERRAWTAIAPR
jgi:hypothetical protein